MIYFDHAATTFIDDEVFKTYEKISREVFANPSSPHALGLKANRLFDATNKRILELLNITKTHQVIHTSGATEANNLAIIGYALKNKNRGNHLICLATEHPSVLEAYRYLEKDHGFQVTYLPLLEDGTPNLEIFKKELSLKTILVSIGFVNSEVGFINPIEKILDLIKDYPFVRLHVDMVQGFGHLPFNFASAVDFMSFSQHKLGGIKGHGILIKKTKAQIAPILFGGGQQDNLRSGTIALPLAVSMSKVMSLAIEKEKAFSQHVGVLREKLVELLEKDARLQLNSLATCSPYVVNFSLLHHKASVVIEALSNHQIYVSSSSACASKANTPSPTLSHLGYNKQLKENSIRVSFSYSNTIEEVELFYKTLDQILKEVKTND